MERIGQEGDGTQKLRQQKQNKNAPESHSQVNCDRL